MKLNTPARRKQHLEYVRNEGRLCRLFGQHVPMKFFGYLRDDTGLTTTEVTRAFRTGWRNLSTQR